MTPRRVVLLNGHAREEARIVETEITRPGMLMEIRPGGLTRPTTVNAGQAAPIFAKEQHENQGNDIEDTIAIGDEVTLLYPELGAKINAWTVDTITEGNRVTPDGNGGVRVADSDDYVIGIADSDSDFSLGANQGRCAIIIAPMGPIV